MALRIHLHAPACSTQLCANNMEAATLAVRVAAGNRSSLQPDASERRTQGGAEGARKMPRPDGHANPGLGEGGSTVGSSRCAGSVSACAGEM